MLGMEVMVRMTLETFFQMVSVMFMVIASASLQMILLFRG
jgi:hypothetical protein